MLRRVRTLRHSFPTSVTKRFRCLDRQPLGGISSSVLSVFFTDKFALSQSDARISVAYDSCQ